MTADLQNKILHFITACFVDLRGRLFHMKQNLNFDKAKTQEFKSKMTKNTQKFKFAKAFFLKKFLHFVCYFCENFEKFAYAFLLAVMI